MVGTFVRTYVQERHNINNAMIDTALPAANQRDVWMFSGDDDGREEGREGGRRAGVCECSTCACLHE